MAYTKTERGQLFSESYALYLRNAEGNLVSPFHDVPLVASGEGNDRILNMVVEVPRWSNAKLEISKSLPLNPITQDIKKGVPRFVANVFPHHGYIWNYGAFPQTWEDPKLFDENTGASGDNDPLDVCDISALPVNTGDVIQVKVLGVLAMIDEGETDWKVIVINAADPLAEQLNDIQDVDSVKPGLLHATLEWFKYYKVPDGKPKNKFGFKNQFKNREFAWTVIDETNASWKSLISSEEGADGISRVNTSLESQYVDQDAANGFLSERDEFNPEAAPQPDSVRDWYYITIAKPEPEAEPTAVVNGEAAASGDAAAAAASEDAAEEAPADAAGDAPPAAAGDNSEGNSGDEGKPGGEQDEDGPAGDNQF